MRLKVIMCSLWKIWVIVIIISMAKGGVADEYILQWADTIDNGSDDWASDVAIDQFGNIVVTGYSEISGDLDYYTVKYDSSGNMLWADTIDNGALDQARGIAVDKSNNIIITGISKIGGYFHFVTIKYDSLGTILWVDTVEYGEVQGVAVDSFNNIIVVGTIEEALTVKYDSSGTVVWKDTIHDEALYLNAVATDYACNIVAVGNIWIDTLCCYYTVKYNPSGEILWSDTIVEFGGRANGIATDLSGNIVVTGNASIGVDEDNEIYTVKYSPSGTMLWADTIDNGYTWDEAYDVTVDKQNNIILTGRCWHRYYTIKYDSLGTILWEDILDDTTYSSWAKGVGVDKSENIIVTGTIYGSGNPNYCTIKYAFVSGVEENNQDTHIFSNKSLILNSFPNPFNSVTEIRYAIPTLDKCKLRPLLATLEIFDISGALVRTLVNELQLPGIYRIAWNAKNNDGKRVGNGVYLCQLKWEDLIITKKLVILK